MSGYVFWCRRCERDHAGECPPAVVTSGRDVYNAIVRAPLVNGVPQAGSRWLIQRRLNPSTWMKPGDGGDSKVYEVSRVCGSRAWIRAEVSGADGTEYEYDLRPWTPDGMGDWRLVPPR